MGDERPQPFFIDIRPRANRARTAHLCQVAAPARVRRSRRSKRPEQHIASCNSARRLSSGPWMAIDRGRWPHPPACPDPTLRRRACSDDSRGSCLPCDVRVEDAGRPALRRHCARCVPGLAVRLHWTLPGPGASGRPRTCGWNRCDGLWESTPITSAGPDLVVQTVAPTSAGSLGRRTYARASSCSVARGDRPLVRSTRLHQPCGDWMLVCAACAAARTSSSSGACVLVPVQCDSSNPAAPDSRVLRLRACTSGDGRRPRARCCIRFGSQPTPACAWDPTPCVLTSPRFPDAERGLCGYQ